MSTALPGPSPTDPRFELIDTLRAFALLGVITMNLTGTVMTLVGEQMQFGPVDQFVGPFDLLFVNGKARCCFAMLFGVGFGMMLMRAESRGGHFGRFFTRRMLALLAFGVINQWFLYAGDILLPYAVLGLSLLLFRSWSDARLIRVGILLNLVPPLFFGLLAALAPESSGRSADAVARGERQLELYRSTHYGDAIVANGEHLWNQWVHGIGPAVMIHVGVLGLFLFGYWIARRGLLTDVDANRPLLRRIAWACVPFGLVLSAVNAAGYMGWSPHGAIRAVKAVSYLGIPTLAVGYLALGALVLDCGARLVKRVMAPIGRMALTNYLVSGAVLCWILYGYGLDQLGKLTFSQNEAVAIAIFVVLGVASHLWLRVFLHGPMEWLWRTLSHASPQAMRRSRKSMASTA